MAIVHLCDVCDKQAKHGEVVQCHGCGKDLCPKCATEHRPRIVAPDGTERLGVAMPFCKDCRAARVAAEDWAASDAGRRHLAKLEKGA